jgi:hypothetical protein
MLSLSQYEPKPNKYFFKEEPVLLYIQKNTVKSTVLIPSAAY